MLACHYHSRGTGVIAVTRKGSLGPELDKTLCIDLSFQVWPFRGQFFQTESLWTWGSSPASDPVLQVEDVVGVGARCPGPSVCLTY